MDEKPLTLEGVKEALKESSPSQKHPVETIKREIDSLDDFEHLGHDSSPLKETISHQDAGDLLGGIQTGTRDTFDEINKRVAESTANKFTDELSSSPPPFDPFNSVSSSGSNLLQETTNKMDSNLLQMGDHFPDRKEADDKLDKFLQEMSSPFTAPISPQEKAVEEKYNVENFIASTKNFVDNERDIIQPPPAKFVSSTTTTSSASPSLLHSNDDLLDRYTDSEPEDDFKPSKYEDFPKKQELPESFSSSDNIKSEVFKDVEDEPLIELPKKEHHVVVKPSAPAPEPPKQAAAVPVEKVEIVKEKTPEPVKIPEKTPEPVKKVAAETKPKIVHTGAEAIFCKMGLDAWFNPDRLNPKVESLIYWRDPKKSGPVFGGVLVVLLALTYFSFISVVAYLSLAGLTGTIAFRIYKNIIQAVQKTGDGHPFKDFLEYDISLPQDKVKEISEVAVAHANAAAIELRRLFLVEDLVDSIKFGVLLWTLTYLGAWFNGMTLIIIAWVALFSLPKVYETNKTQIDANLDIVRTKLAEITSKVKAAIPIGKKEEKKEQ